MLFSLKNFVKTTRFKHTLWFTSIFLILEITSGLIFYFYLKNSMYKDLDSSLSEQAESIYKFVKDSKIDFEKFQPDSVYSSSSELVYDLIFDLLVMNSRNTYIQVQSKNKVIFKSENLGNNEISFRVGQTDRPKLISFRKPDISPYMIRGAFFSRPGYKITAAYPEKHIDETLSSLLEIYVIISPFFLIISIIGGAFISAKSLARIDSIIKRTDEITTQNLDENIEGAGFNDEYGRLVRTMNKMIARIKTSIEMMNQFSISASHELKTPLTILRGELELALKSPKTPGEYREVLCSNYEETLRLIDIVDKLFFLSKIDHSSLKLEMQKVDSGEFINETCSQIRNLGKQRGIEIEAIVDSAGIIEIDKGLMQRVLTNLVDNAIKYGEENQKVCIKSSHYKKGKIILSVLNKGEGIPEKEVEKIFERFYRVDSSRSRETGGIGLGLSISKAIVDYHGGEIQLKSAPGGVTEFSIILNSIESASV
ncbi:MAG TPA: ATP-binding protein [Ignavibacteriaceae bacterium]|nr:ATP-binding protein [Ignavibacteriaceae bacterium]